MEMTGERRIPAPRQLVWERLNDPEILKQCIPGCETIEKVSDTEFTAKVVARVGPVKATFTGKVTLSDLHPPAGYTITGEGQGLKNPTADPLGGILPILISVPVLSYLVWRLTHTRLGQAWAAIREDELAASSNGINVPLYKMIAFIISAVVAGYAGALETHINFFVDPTEYGISRTIQILTFAVVGGTTNVVGPVVGAIFLTALPEIIRWASAYRDVVNGVILILVIIFRPQGIVGRGGLAIIPPRWWTRRRASERPAPAR